MPIIPPPPVEKAHLPNTVTSQSVSSPSRGSTRRKWIYYERIGELKELSKDEEHFSSSIDKLYNFCSKKNKQVIKHVFFSLYNLYCPSISFLTSADHQFFIIPSALFLLFQNGISAAHPGIWFYLPHS